MQRCSASGDCDAGGDARGRRSSRIRSRSRSRSHSCIVGPCLGRIPCNGATKGVPGCVVHIGRLASEGALVVSPCILDRLTVYTYVIFLCMGACTDALITSI